MWKNRKECGFVMFNPRWEGLISKKENIRSETVLENTKSLQTTTGVWAEFS